MAKYDYGSAALNQAHYGRDTPPILPFESIHKVPIGLFVGKQDDFADPTDVLTFKPRLSTLAVYKEYDQMDHMSFAIGKNMGFMADVIQLLKSKANETDEVDPTVTQDAQEFLV